MGTPHDTLFHFTFRHPRHAAAWLRSCLPPALVARLDWSTLRLCSEKVHGLALRIGVTDIVYEILFHGRDSGVYVVIEHRSYDDPGLHDKLVRYSVHLAHGPRRRRSSPPTPVIAVVFYHGPGALRLEPRHRGPLAGIDPVAAELLASLQPRLRCIGDDVTACTEAQLLARDLTQLCTMTHLGLRFLPGFTAAETLAAIDRWGPILRAVDTDEGPPIGSEAISKIGWYILHVNETPAEDVHMAIQRNLGRTEETIMSTAEKLHREGHAKGLTEGHTVGHTVGRAETLLRQMNRRFGPLPMGIEERLRAASTAELDRWTDRILDCKTLDALFADD